MPKESAEEKLLKMMQKSGNSVAAKPSSPSFKKKFKFSFTIGTLNIILFLGIVACLIWLIAFEIPSGVALLQEAVTFPAGSRTEGALSDMTLPAVPSAEYYLQKINERDIFKPYVPKVVQKARAQGMVQLMSRFKLVGISWLDLPETASVMLEDTQKNETYFLKQGEQIEGVTVKTIYTDRVVFSHENEEITIKL